MLQTYGSLATAEGLAEVAAYASGIGPDKQAYILNITKGKTVHCAASCGSDSVLELTRPTVYAVACNYCNDEDCFASCYEVFSCMSADWRQLARAHA